MSSLPVPSPIYSFWARVCGIGATIRIGREILCLPYAGFFFKASLRWLLIGLTWVTPQPSAYVDSLRPKLVFSYYLKLPVHHKLATKNYHVLFFRIILSFLSHLSLFVQGGPLKKYICILFLMTSLSLLMYVYDHKISGTYCCIFSHILFIYLWCPGPTGTNFLLPPIATTSVHGPVIVVWDT